MAKVHIFRNGLKDEELQELIELLKAVGCEVVMDEDDDIALAPDGDAEDEEVLVVVLTDACLRDPALGVAAKRLTAAGGRLVGLWPKGAKDGEIPGPLEKHGADVATWNRTAVARAIEGEKEPQWETAKGAPRAEPTTKRHRC